MNPVMTMKAGREKSLRQRHPWIFSGAVDAGSGNPRTGETVAVRASDGSFLAWAAYSPESKIRGRVWSFDEQESIDAGFFRRKLQNALNLRTALVPAGETTALRLVHGESDGLPGLVVDRYADVLVMQVLSAGAEAWREAFADALLEITGVGSIYERSDVEVRRLEGLEERVGLLRGRMPPAETIIEESGLKFAVDVAGGQKTGFYIDQRRNRQRVGALVHGGSLLNCFCYTGAFTAYALRAGAERVLSIDSSAEAVAAAQRNVARNALNDGRDEWITGDVFQQLRLLRDRAARFDSIILDPPKFAPTAAQAEAAARGYKDINLLAFKLLKPGGLLFTFSCSGGISADLFQKIVAGAALDAGVDARIIEYLAQGPDHPVALNYPEGAYLKGLICQVGG